MRNFITHINKTFLKNLIRKGDVDFALVLKNYWNLKKERVSIKKKNYRKPFYIFYKKRIYKRKIYAYINRPWTTGYRMHLLKYRMQYPKLPAKKLCIKNSNKTIKIYTLLENSGFDVKKGDYAEHISKNATILFKL